MSGRIFLYNAWREKCGLSEVNLNPKTSATIDELRETEWSSHFENLMRNRLIMCALRYGRLHEKNKPEYDRIESMIKRLQAYKKSGNTEYLVDVASLALCEFEEGKHPNKHFHSIDDGEHTNTKENI